MKRLINDLLADEAGFLLSAELVVIATVAVLGLTVMLVAVRDSIGGEMTDLANSFRNIDQSYGYGGMLGHQTRTGYTSWTAGSRFLDTHLREPGSEFDIVIEDHHVGCHAGNGAVPFHAPIPAAPCPSPCPQPCPLPCEAAPCTTDCDCVSPCQPLQQPGCDPCLDGISSAVIQPLPAPCLDCPDDASVRRVIQGVVNAGPDGHVDSQPNLQVPYDRLSNDREFPAAPPVTRGYRTTIPHLSTPVTRIPAGPLQVW